MLREQYSKTFDFIKKDILKTYCICFVIFVFMLVLTAYLTYYMVGMDGAKSLIKGLHETMTNETDDTSVNMTWYDIFIHNSRANLFAMLSGLIPFLFIPVIIMILNAVITGFALGAFALVYQLSILTSFLSGIAPHGVLECAVNILGFALGITLCRQMISGIKNKNIKTTIPCCIKNSLRVYILVILPVLLIAGIVESTITPLVIDLIK